MLVFFSNKHQATVNFNGTIAKDVFVDENPSRRLSAEEDDVM